MAKPAPMVRVEWQRRPASDCSTELRRDAAIFAPSVLNEGNLTHFQSHSASPSKFLWAGSCNPTWK